MLLGYAFVVAPALHAVGHASRGAGHVHVGEARSAERDGDAAHRASHELFELAALGDVVTAGTVIADCALAEYTLLACVEGSDHAPLFGDGLLHRHEEPTPPREHGRGSLEHGSASLLAAAPILVPPPSSTSATLPCALLGDQHLAPAQRLHAQRGPPEHA